MLPMKIDLTEEIATLLHDLRLKYPVNGEILTAEKLSKAIGNNRAWMSQIESRRLKKIKREDIIAIYQLLFDEQNAELAEKMVESDLTKNIYSRYHDTFSEGLASLDKLMVELKDVLIRKYKSFEDDGDRNTLLGCLESMIDNFNNDYEHTHLIYTVPISYADPKYFGEQNAKEYYDTLDKIYHDYSMALSDAYVLTDSKAFSDNYLQIYDELMNIIKSISFKDSVEDIIELIMSLESFNSAIIRYAQKCNQDTTFHQKVSLDISKLLQMSGKMLDLLLKKLDVHFSFSFTQPQWYMSVHNSFKKDILFEKDSLFKQALMDCMKAIKPSR